MQFDKSAEPMKTVHPAAEEIAIKRQPKPPETAPSKTSVHESLKWRDGSFDQIDETLAAEEPPLDETWQEFADFTRDWRRLLTSNGVFDTLISFAR